MTETIQLQSVGHVPAIPASEMREGDVRMYNFGSTALIIKIIPKSDKTLTYIIWDAKNNGYYMSDIRKTTLVAIVKRDQDVSEHRPTEAHNNGIVDVSAYFPQLPIENEITATIDQQGIINISNNDAADLVKKVVKGNATKAESELLSKYHLQLQELGMNYKNSLPKGFESLINPDAMYKAISCFSNEGGEAGKYQIEVTGNVLEGLINRNDVLEVLTPFLPNNEQEEPDNICEAAPAEAQSATGVTYSLNEAKQGIEITFPSKPSQDVIQSLKLNGFRWGKGYWYAKQSEERLSFAKSICSNDGSIYNSQPITERQEYTYPEIDIDDIDSYTIDINLQKREHDSAFTFRRNEIDRTKEIQTIFTQYNNKALELLELTDDSQMVYNIKRTLQSFKKHYYALYVKMLNHRANNPSWAVTGRGGINVSRYNKMSDRYDKMMSESVQLTNSIEKDLKSFSNKIKDAKVKSINNMINEQLSNVDNMPTFTTESKPVTVAGYTETVRTYNYNGYAIAKTWGKFRVFKDGKEIQTTLKTTSKLEDAKKYVVYLASQSSEAV